MHQLPCDIPSTETLYSMLQSIPEGLVLVDNLDRVLWINSSAEHILSIPATASCMRSIDELIHTEDDNSTIGQRVLPGEKAGLLSVRDHRQQVVTLLIACVQLKDVEVSGSRLYSFHLATEDDAIAQRMYSNFLANISHEFRTPLSALKASVELLLEAIEDLSKDQIVELLNSLHFSVTALQTLIDNLLESVSIEVGKFQIRKRAINVNDVILDATRIMKPLLDRRRQELILELPDAVPEVQVDPMRLNQVLVNLLSNASKYGPLEKPIRVSLTMQGTNALHFSIVDQGPGISHSDQENIFRPFVRLDQEKTKVQFGIGLGLSVVNKIIESHGGQVGYSRIEGSGNEFWFSLPLEDGS